MACFITLICRKPHACDAHKMSTWNKATSWTVWGSNSGRERNFLFSKTSRPSLGPTQPTQKKRKKLVSGVLSRIKSGRSLKLTTNVHLKPRLRMNGTKLYSLYTTSRLDRDNLFSVETDAKLGQWLNIYCIKSAVRLWIRKTLLQSSAFITLRKATLHVDSETKQLPRNFRSGLEKSAWLKATEHW